MCAKPYEQVATGHKKETVKHYSIIGETMTSESIDNEYRIFVPNVKRGAPRNMHFSPNDEEFVTVTPEQIDHEISWFIGAFDAEISKLCAAYGEDDVTIEWAMFSWSS